MGREIFQCVKLEQPTSARASSNMSVPHSLSKQPVSFVLVLLHSLSTVPAACLDAPLKRPSDKGFGSIPRTTLWEKFEHQRRSYNVRSTRTIRNVVLHPSSRVNLEFSGLCGLVQNTDIEKESYIHQLDHAIWSGISAHSRDNLWDCQYVPSKIRRK